ncbi:hypothetical protein [Mycobacterium decipiens]|uniref:Uncharacterized protein n=1 Tax=Mycobacterium decipiens TaxID=1430326 RepID=A0A1X2LZ35_9MYCO|nr:hypothetical protein [Mycobacterium decipiens]OSC41969.1 hypothetical protein B8W66_05355 [Mycobacterium decipiens]
MDGDLTKPDGPRLVVGVGWGGPGVGLVLGSRGGAGGRASGVVVAALGGDAVGAVLGAGAAAPGHHGGRIRPHRSR